MEKSESISTTDQLKLHLDQKVVQYNAIQFIETDPISIPHQFTKKEDIEISGFLAATLSWGQRVTIINNAKKLMVWMDHQPHDFILNFSEKDLKPFRKFVHRTFNGEDCEYFLWALKNIYQHYASLENAFTKNFTASEPNTKKAIINFRNRFFGFQPVHRAQKHVADPAKNASAKRLNMFMRWMVRKDDARVDFGIWNKIKPSQLICPLDTHSGRAARKLGLLNRNANDWQAAEELTASLARFNPQDPVKYDFALFGLGVFEKI
ncbi:MAG: TIGR02757 family protein [Bacteroidales bacterium]|nr:TIGR02757 family protein [Bacteroidales bacterium]